MSGATRAHVEDARERLAAAVEDLMSEEAYAIASGRCAICNRTLTVPASIHRGIGPECAKNI